MGNRHTNQQSRTNNSSQSIHESLSDDSNYPPLGSSQYLTPSKHRASRNRPLPIIPPESVQLDQSNVNGDSQELISLSKTPGFIFEYSPDCDFITDVACCICFEPYYTGMHMQMLPCNHIYHYECIDEWRKKSNTCPICCTKCQN